MIHYCGWDRECRKNTDWGDGPLHRVNISVGKHYWYFNLKDWRDRGYHKNQPFYEEDEPVEDVRKAFNEGQKRKTLVRRILDR
jgi:hypothetical protein